MLNMCLSIGGLIISTYAKMNEPWMKLSTVKMTICQFQKDQQMNNLEHLIIWLSCTCICGGKKSRLVLKMFLSINSWNWVSTVPLANGNLWSRSSTSVNIEYGYIYPQNIPTSLFTPILWVSSAKTRTRVPRPKSIQVPGHGNRERGAARDSPAARNWRCWLPPNYAWPLVMGRS